MPARVYVPPVKREPAPFMVKAIFVFVLTLIAMVYFRIQTVSLFSQLLDEPVAQQGLVSLPNWGLGNDKLQVPAEPPKKVRMDFAPPNYLTQEQLDYIKMVDEIIQDPSSWGVKKPPIPMDHNTRQVYLSLLGYEASYQHYDDYGNVKQSYVLEEGDQPCCEGGAQVNKNSSVCTREEIADMRYNAWCGATIFWEYYQQWGLKAGSRAYEITVAVYKNAVLMTPDKSAMVLDDNGLPIIGEDDPTTDMDFHDQVQTVFIDPYTGLPRFTFTYE